jgi:ankyrin repeat protein
MIKVSHLSELHLFAGGGDQVEVRLILSRGHDPNVPDDDGWTPLHWACYRHQPEMVELLLEHGALVANKSFSGDTPLHAAATEGSVPCLKLVLDAATLQDADYLLESQNNVGYTPLMWTASKGLLAAAKFLLFRGSDVAAANQEGDSVLHVAASNGQAAFVALLLEEGANVDAKNKAGDTALHCSAIEGHVAASLLLLRGGAGEEVTNGAGQTPMDLAKFWGQDTTAIAKFKAQRAARLKKGPSGT